MEWLPGKRADGGTVRAERLQRPKQPRRQQRPQQDDGDGIQADGLGRSQLRCRRAVEFLWRERLAALYFVFLFLRGGARTNDFTVANRRMRNPVDLRVRLDRPLLGQTRLQVGLLLKTATADA